MNIVIAGAGKVGYTVAEQLNREKHDLTIIENDHEKLTRVTNEMDVYAFEGNAGSLSVLKDAGVGNADVFIVGPESHCINIPLRDLKIRSGILLASVVRDGKGHVPDGKTEIREGDRVVVVTAEKGITDLDSILED